MRVLFQMSPTDSGHLLDSPLASKLGPHRAFFSSEEQNRIEKFRPYGVPDDEWLSWVQNQLANRAMRRLADVAAVNDRVTSHLSRVPRLRSKRQSDPHVL